MQVRGGSVLTGAGFASADIVIEGERFAVVDPQGTAATAADGQVLDASGCYVVPGLIDLHFHGCVGHDFCDGTEEAIDAIARHEASCGVTAICPATMTYPEDVLAPIMDAAASYEAKRDGAALVGINMEGPFISPSKVGAQNPDYVRNPSAEEFRRLQEAAGGLFKLVDIAPEEPGAEEFIREMANEVRISLAHTCTDYDTAVRAFELGARQLTHLYNAMDPMHHRKPGPIPAAVEHGEVTAEIIADGVHIHPAMVRLAFQLFGDDRMILISDTLRAAGLEDGTYDLGGQDVIVRGPVATIDNGALAGSVSDLMRCLTVAVRDMGIPLASAVKAASANPARALGLDAERGAIEPGKVADAVLLDKETLDVKAVVLRGELLA